MNYSFRFQASSLARNKSHFGGDSLHRVCSGSSAQIAAKRM